MVSRRYVWLFVYYLSICASLSIRFKAKLRCGHSIGLPRDAFRITRRRVWLNYLCMAMPMTDNQGNINADNWRENQSENSDLL